MLHCLLVFLSTCILLSASIYEYSSPCCTPGSTLNSTDCVAPDGSVTNLLLNCTNGMYLLDPNEFKEESFSENSDTNELNIFPEETKAKAGTWCVAQLHVENVVSTAKSSSQPVAIVCFSDNYMETSDRELVFSQVYGVLLFISFGFLLVTLAVYVALPEMRDLQGKCLMANITCLALGFIALAIIQLYGTTLDDDACVFKAFFIYFWLLSSFFWLNVVSFNVWRSVQSRGRPAMKEQHLFIIFCCYAWGVPFIFLCASLGAHFAPHELNLLRPRFGHSRCWFHGPEETWAYFYGPVAILITFNTIFFALTAIRLWGGGVNNASARVRSHKSKCLLYLKLFVVMGITWIFEIISFAVGEMSWFWYITDMVNCLQGLLIFLILVCRKRTMRAASSRKWGAAMCPKYLVLAGEDEEDSDDAAAAEEVELSRPAP